MNFPELAKLAEANGFWGKAVRCGDCLLWTEARNGAGYGAVGNKFGVTRAHRVAYWLAKGPFELKLCVCHTCDVRNCIEPSHLFIGTRKDNNADGRKKGRMHPVPHHYGEKNPASIGRELAAEIKRQLDAGVTHRELTKAYGVSKTPIKALAAGRHWTQR